MFGIGTGELLLLLLIALIVLGPERMPQLARDIGKAMNDLRKTSDELQKEFLNADRTLSAEKLLDVATRAAEQPSTAPAPADPEPAPAEASATHAAPAATGSGQAAADGNEVVTPAEPEETAFDREARLARERLEDPARSERAAAEGWTVPTDEAGTSDRVG